METYIGFFHGDKLMARISLKGYFSGEIKATKELIAEENGLKPEDIEWKPVYISDGRMLVK